VREALLKLRDNLDLVGMLAFVPALGIAGITVLILWLRERSAKTRKRLRVVK